MGNALNIQWDKIMNVKYSFIHGKKFKINVKDFAVCTTFWIKIIY